MEVSDQLHAPALYPQGSYPFTHWMGGWACPSAGLDVVSKRKIPSPRRDSKPLIIQPVTQRYTTELTRLLNSSLVSAINEHRVQG
jgi:hypothetical protein